VTIEFPQVQPPPQRGLSRTAVIALAAAGTAVVLLCGVCGILVAVMPDTGKQAASGIQPGQTTTTAAPAAPAAPTRTPTRTPEPTVASQTTPDEPTTTEPAPHTSSSRPKTSTSQPKTTSKSPKTTTTTASTPAQNCDPHYPTICVRPFSEGDLNCGDIPFRNFKVLPPDPHKFDADKDGIGCES